MNRQHFSDATNKGFSCSEDIVFEDLNSMLSFIARGQLHNLLIFFVYISLSVFSSCCSFIAACISCTIPFTMLTIPGLDNVFVRVCYMGFEGYFWSQAYSLISWWLVSIIPLSCCFSSSHVSFGIGVRDQSLGALVPSIKNFVFLHLHGRLVCFCLVCEVFFTFLLVVVLSVLQACIFLLFGDFGLPIIVLPLVRFLGSLRWCLIAFIFVRRITLFQILSFYLLFYFYLFWPRHFMVE